MSNLITKIAAAALFAGLLATSAQAQSKKPFEGVVLVAAVPMDEIQPKALREFAKPKFKRGQIVKYSTAMAPGSIVVHSKQNVLFYVLGNGKAVKYRVATARKGFEWSGTNKVSFKTEWPDWRPPTEMRARHPELPSFHGRRHQEPPGRPRHLSRLVDLPHSRHQ